MTQRCAVTRFSRGAAVMVAVVAALLLAGCSDNNTDTSPADPNLTTPSAAATGSDLPRFPVPSTGTTITMPRLEGLTVTQARTALSKAGWTANKDDLTPQGVIVADGQPVDVIVSQQPHDGTVMSDNTQVFVQVGVHK